MKTIPILIVLTLLAGCRVGSKSPERIYMDKEKIEYRMELFEKCMAAASSLNKATTQHYNDLNEVVDSCNMSAYYMTNQVY